jgi:Na+/proline symporter
MDRLVYATRLDRVLFRRVQPRTLRWTPLSVFAALIAGYVLMAKTVERPDRVFIVGWLLFYGAYIAAAFLRIFGPRFVPSALHPLDEREMTVKMRAYALSGILLTGLTMLGCFYLAAAGLLGWWQPHSPNDWIALGFGVQATAMLLPTMIASWAEPRAVPDQDD